MTKDIDMNIQAIFCLNALSENDNSHVYIRQSGFYEDQQQVESSKEIDAEKS